MSKSKGQKKQDAQVQQMVNDELAALGIQRGSMNENDAFNGCRQIVNKIVMNFKKRHWEGTVLRMTILLYCFMYVFPMPGDDLMELDDVMMEVE